MDFNGSITSHCKSIDIGKLTADIYESKSGAGHVTNKTPVNIKHSEATFECGMGMGKGLYDFIQSSFLNKHLYANGAALVADIDGNVYRRFDFTHALMTEFSVPKLSGESKDMGSFTVKFDYEIGRWTDGGGKIDANSGTDKVKRWRLNNFKLEIDGLDCSTVAEVDAISFKQKVTQDQLGHVKEATKIPTQLELGGLKVTMGKGPKGKVEKNWTDAAKKWFIDGEHEDKNEMTGRLVWLGPNLQEELGHIDFKHIGFKEFTYAKLERGDKPSRFTADMYFEECAFTIK